MSRKTTRIVVGVVLWVAAILFIAVGMVVTTAGAQEPGKRVVELRLEGGTVTGDINIAGGLGVVRVTQGDEVELRWTADETTAVHLHGYNVETELAGTGETVMSFKAKFGGRFALEAHIHGSGDKTILYIEVRPR